MVDQTKTLTMHFNQSFFEIFVLLLLLHALKPFICVHHTAWTQLANGFGTSLTAKIKSQRGWLEMVKDPVRVSTFFHECGLEFS